MFTIKLPLNFFGTVIYGIVVQDITKKSIADIKFYLINNSPLKNILPKL